MRALMIMFDTLSRDYLSNYGNEWMKTPNFQRLREQTTTFDQFYGGSWNLLIILFLKLCKRTGFIAI